MQNFIAINWLLIGLIIAASILLTYYTTIYLISWAKANSISDDPASARFRKFQSMPVTLIGGTGACLAATSIISIIWVMLKYNLLDSNLLKQNISEFRLIYYIIAVIIMLVVGYLDDKFQLKAYWQLLSILTGISLVVFLGGIRIYNISWIGELDWMVSIFITFAWLGFATASTKFLDGHDGLVASVGIFNFLTIASISLSDKINQPLIFLMSVVWAVCLSVFLYFNFPNATAYLGEGASELIGFTIGVLAILSGAKLATALSILGWFIIDILLVWAIRIREGRNPITSADRNHWHHRLLLFGLNKIQVLVVTWALLIISSFIGIYGNTVEKICLILGQTVVLLAIYALTPKNK
jgi:UDP-GlcNAc:undecaprenyl-phosphate/decaprenyl-phosphate GlcNAc-1-phosphate transferase